MARTTCTAQLQHVAAPVLKDGDVHRADVGRELTGGHAGEDKAVALALEVLFPQYALRDAVPRAAQS